MTEAAKKTLRQPTITVNHFIPFRFFFFLIQLINFHMREGSLKQTLRNKYNQWLYNVTNVTLSHLVYCINKLFKKYNKLVWKIWSGLKNYEPEVWTKIEPQQLHRQQADTKRCQVEVYDHCQFNDIALVANDDQ